MKAEKDMEFLQSRNTSFDLLRIVAAIMVVMLHVAASKWHAMLPDRTEWMAMNFYDCLARSAVPLFFMLSGAFMLKKDIPLKTLYLKKILPLILIYLSWSFLYAIDDIGFANLHTVDIEYITTATINSHFHLWFIPVLIGVYILQPVLRAIVDYKDGTYVKYLLGVFFLFGIARSTVLLFVTDANATSLLTRITVELTSYAGYVVLGYYLANMHKRQYKPWVLLIGFVVVVSITAYICQMDALLKGRPEGLLYGEFTIATFLEAVCLFLFFKNLKCSYSLGAKKIIYHIASWTFGIYLLHPFLIYQLEKRFSLNILSYNTTLAIPINTVLIVAICFLVISILSQIPVVKRLCKY